MADATVEIPKLGSVKKSYLLVGGAAAAGIVGYALYKRRQNTAAAQQSGANAQSALDQAMTPADYSSGSTVNSTTSTSLAGSLPVDNGTWYDTAIQKMQLAGYDPGVVSAAIAKWEAHQPLTQDEANIVNAARAAVGEDPPQGGPFPVIIQSGTSGSTGVPGRVTDLSFMSGTATRTGFALHWSPVAGATDYTVNVGPKTLTGAGSVHPVTTTPSIVIQGLKPNTVYYANVESHNATGFGPGGNQLTNLKTLP